MLTRNYTYISLTTEKACFITPFVTKRKKNHDTTEKYHIGFPTDSRLWLKWGPNSGYTLNPWHHSDVMFSRCSRGCPKFDPHACQERSVSRTAVRLIVVHTHKFFRSLIKSIWIQIVFTNFRLIWIQTDVRSVPNQPENGKYNLISGLFKKKIEKILSV